MRPESFIERQIVQIQQGGPSVLVTKFLRALQLAFAIPIVLIIRVLRPLVLMRFGQLNSLPIGIFAAGTEMYLCERDAGLQPMGRGRLPMRTKSYSGVSGRSYNGGKEMRNSVQEWAPTSCCRIGNCWTGMRVLRPKDLGRLLKKTRKYKMASSHFWRRGK